MATAKRIAKNTSFLIAGTLVQKFLSFLLIIYMARVLGAERFGVYSFVFSFIVLFNVVSDLGLTTFFVRETAKDRKQAAKLLGSSALLKIALSAISLLGIFAAITLLGYDAFVIELVVLAGVSMVLDSMAGLFRAIFFATERMEFDFVVNTVQKAFILAASVFVLFTGHGLLALTLVMVAASLLSLALSACIAIALFARPAISFEAGFYKRLLSSALPFCFIVLFMALYSNLDMTMLSFFHKGSPEFVGYYSTAMRLINTLGLIPVALTSAVFPVLSRFFAQKNNSVSLVIEKSMGYLLIIILPIAFGTTILSERIIEFFFTSEFAAAGTALRILIWFCAISFLNVVFLNVMNSINKEKTAAAIVAITLCINALLNYFWIPQYNYIGASFATIVSGLCFLAMGYFVVRKDFKSLSVARALSRPLLASLAMAALVFFAQGLNLWLITATASLFYFGFLFFIGGFSKEDLRIFRQVLRIEGKPSVGALIKDSD